MRQQAQVRQFMQAMIDRGGIQVIGKFPEIRNAELRRSLLQEEVDEFTEAYQKGDLVEVVDALTDIIYIALGGFVECGVNAELIFDEVHRTNMEKFSEGGYAREDGKWIKPPNWEGPEIGRLLEQQRLDAGKIPSAFVPRTNGKIAAKGTNKLTRG